MYNARYKRGNVPLRGFAARRYFLTVIILNKRNSSHSPFYLYYTVIPRDKMEWSALWRDNIWVGVEKKRIYVTYIVYSLEMDVLPFWDYWIYYRYVYNKIFPEKLFCIEITFWIKSGSIYRFASNLGCQTLRLPHK